MRQLTRGLLVGLMLGVAVLGSVGESQAQQLKTVLVDGLWGSAIGGLTGLAMWALQEKDGQDKLFSRSLVTLEWTVPSGAATRC